jgi:DNA-binding Lrp family transcriptional regulator
MQPLDRIDRAIVRHLQEDGRIANARLAQLVSLSESSCLRRVKALESAGLIEGYTALVDQQRAGFPVNVFVSLTLQRQDHPDLESFERAVREIPEVMECYLMTGEFDYLVRIAVRDMNDFERVHNHSLTRLPNVARVHSSIAIRRVKRGQVLPLEAAARHERSPPPRRARTARP